MTYRISKLVDRSTVKTGFVIFNGDYELTTQIRVTTEKEYGVTRIKFIFLTPYAYRKIDPADLRDDLEEIVKKLGFDYKDATVHTEVYVTHGTAKENRRHLTKEIVHETWEFFRSIRFGRKTFSLTDGTKDLNKLIFCGFSNRAGC